MMQSPSRLQRRCAALVLVGWVGLVMASALSWGGQLGLWLLGIGVWRWQLQQAARQPVQMDWQDGTRLRWRLAQEPQWREGELIEVRGCRHWVAVQVQQRHPGSQRLHWLWWRDGMTDRSDWRALQQRRILKARHRSHAG